MTSTVRAWLLNDAKQEISLTRSQPDRPVTVHDGTLSISGERRRETTVGEGSAKRVERTYGVFERRFKLPPGAKEEGVSAKLDHGVLKVSVPKQPALAEKQPLRVKVETPALAASKA